MKRRHQHIAAFALALALGLILSMQVQSLAAIIKPTAVSTNITGDAGSSHLYLLDDNGGFAAASLQRPAGTGVTLNTGESLANAMNTVAELSSSGQAESWTRPTGSGNPEFVFDLGADTAVGSIILWQYGNNGGPGTTDHGNHTRDFRVILHTNAEGNSFDFGTETADLSGTMDDIPGNVAAVNYAQFFSFGTSQTARFVAVRIDNNYGSQFSGGDRYGLGEVRLASETVVPEPSTFALAGFGLFGAIGFGRRRKR
jgi:hypothetical protein